VAVVAAAADFLRLAGESSDGAMLLNGNDKETLTAGAPPVSQQPSACILPMLFCKPLALAVVLKTALSCTFEAPCERDPKSS
jgi:hypothetical protein